MNTELYPWRKYRDIQESLAAARPILTSLGVIEPGGGCTEEEIAIAERRLAEPIPPDVREFFRVMRPAKLFGAGGGKEFGFYPLQSKDLSWRAMNEAEPEEQWIWARGLTLGQSAYGDPFWWVKGHRSLPDGSIVLLDHDGGLGDVMFVHFARTFMEFIAKVAHFGNLHPAPGDLLFEREYRELNLSAQK